MTSPGPATGIRLLGRTLSPAGPLPSWPAASADFLTPDSPARRCLVLDSCGTSVGCLADQPIDEFVLTGPVSSSDAHATLAGLRDRLRDIRLDERDQPTGNRFIGGWAGLLGYEFGAALEGVGRARVDDIPLPAVRLALYDAVACCDQRTGGWQLFALVLDSERSANRRLDELEDRLRRCAGEEPSANVGVAASDWLRSARSSMSRDDYEQGVARAKEYIAAGDIYQVNLAQRLTWRHSGGAAVPGRLFEAMRQRHPADFAAFLAWQDAVGQPAAVCSVSPELFLAVDGRRVTTRPIKGTRRRAGADDFRSADALLASAKDAAELAMIVDLERNDLGRVCRFGSVRVTEPRRVQSLPHVYHTYATVEGDLADGRDMIDLLEASFPGGSITGAPKIRAMQIIAELEPTVRSAYTGAVGYLGADGRAMLNIAIRTAIVAGQAMHLHVGAGIVADSQPAAEYEETLAKAEGLAQAMVSVAADG